MSQDEGGQEGEEEGEKEGEKEEVEGGGEEEEGREEAEKTVTNEGLGCEQDGAGKEKDKVAAGVPVRVEQSHILEAEGAEDSVGGSRTAGQSRNSIAIEDGFAPSIELVGRHHSAAASLFQRADTPADKTLPESPSDASLPS